MNSEPPDRRHLQRLRALAESEGVVITYVDDRHGNGHPWNGLYIRTPNYKSGIALNSSLSLEWQAWVLAHEMGHHFEPENVSLLPFGWHKANPETKRWGKWESRKPAEVSANYWALDYLTTHSDWLEAEKAYPCDPIGMSKYLGLPLVAYTTWEKRNRSSNRKTLKSSFCEIPLMDELKEVLSRKITCSGGHQSYFKRQISKIFGDFFYLSRLDFGIARERAYTADGGWQIRYRTIIKAVEKELLTQKLDSLFSKQVPSNIGCNEFTSKIQPVQLSLDFS